jgi:hypothetical protein
MRMYGDVPEKTDGDDENRFYALVYPPSGSTEGVSPWKLSDLSDQWLEFWCHALADLPYFEDNLPPPFEAVRLRYHTDESFGVADFFFNDVFFSTSVLLRGKNRAQEAKFLTSMVEVARDRQKQVGLKQTSFKELLEAQERPLHAVFVWTYQRDEKYQIVPELTMHLAGAFLSGFEI